MFVKIYNALFDYGLKPKELMVFLFLSYCQNCLGTTTVRSSTIQARCGLSENTVRSAVAGLEEKSLLVVSARRNQDGRRISNQYKLRHFSGPWGKLPVQAFALSCRDFSVFAYLCRCARGHKAYPSFRHLAATLHMSVSTVQAAIKSLAAAGKLLKAAFRAGKHNLYILMENAIEVKSAASVKVSKKEGRRAGTRRPKRKAADFVSANLTTITLPHELGCCQEVLRALCRGCVKICGAVKRLILLTVQKEK